jgi:hypothetical protein
MTSIDTPQPVEADRNRVIQLNWLLIEIGIIGTVWYWLIASWWSGVIIPGGLEFSRSMHSFFFWQNWMQCGECAFWGNLNGGGPTLQDMYGSFLHPLAMVSTIQLGAISGSAITVSLSFLLMALASWWFAYYLGMHVVARVWFALANMLGGHMLCRLELGNVGLALSLASAWCAIVTIIWFVDRPTLARGAVVAIATGSAMLAGQGYMQLLLISMMPFLGYYAWQQQFFAMPKTVLVRMAVLIFGLVLLMTAPLWLNMLYPNQLYVKETTGDNNYYQPITRLFVNLMLDEYDIAKSDIYNNYPYPWVYSTFIGLSSVVFALTGVYWVTQKRNRFLYLLFMGIAIWSALIASGLLRSIVQYIPNESLQVAVAGLRYLVVANGFFALAMLVMALFAINAILTETHWWPALLQRLFVRLPANVTLSIVVVVILIVNVQQLYQYNKSWLDDVNGYDENQQAIVDLLIVEPHAIIRAPDWMLMPLLQNNFKMTEVTIPWQTPVFQLPEPRYILSMEPPVDSELIKVHNEHWSLYRNTRIQSGYAVVFHADGTMTPCESVAMAGDVAVSCVLDRPGELRVAEFYVPGWLVSVNGVDTLINTSQVGNVDNLNLVRIALSAGTNNVEMRFRPWHATVSMYAYFAGWVIALLIIIVPSTKRKPTDAK